MIRLSVKGDTYRHKDEFKNNGFRWNSQHRVWYKIFEDTDTQLKFFADCYKALGFDVLMVTVDTAPKDEPKYMIKESWIFNLESMHDKVWCLIYDIREGSIMTPFDVAGKTINSEDDLFELMDEAGRLGDKARNRKVTSKEYGRIREIVTWRVNARYTTCMANGMNEADAGKCFEDI